jgi:hypothetical protein
MQIILFERPGFFCLLSVCVCVFFNDNAQQGLKRSVTTLRGGSLGYAEIVAVKVFQCF